MKSFFRFSMTLMLMVPVAFLASCAHTKAVPDKPMEFETGMKALAEDIAGQLEKSSVGKTLNKVVVNPQTKRSQLKKIVIEPFYDSDSGNPLKINPRISRIISDAMEKRFTVPGQKTPDNLEISEFVVTGMVSLEGAGAGRRYKVYSAVFEKATGVVQASAEVRIANFDTTPEIQKPPPVQPKVQNVVEERPAPPVKKKHTRRRR